MWTLNRYRCAVVDEGKTYTIVDTFEWLQDVLRHCYVVACADARGSGASFGTFEGMFSRKETQDAYDITEWLGTRSWSNGNVGMYGRSYLGITQYMAAGQKPPHLKALFPEVAVADMYELIYKGGIYHGPFIEMWSNLVRQMDVDQPAPPVDEDPDGSLLKAAIEQHKANRSAADIFAALPYRDSIDRVSGVMPFRDWTPITYLKEIQESKVAVYHLAGWYDRYVRDQLVLYRNLSNPQRISIGPWTHTQREHFDFAAEHLRWWDYWLKGIDNGVMQEEPVHYFILGAPDDRAWRSARTWPLPQERRTKYWFSPSNGLGTETPKTQGGKDEFTVDYTAAIAPDPRWSVERQFPELSANDAKGLTYTTPPLTAPLEVTYEEHFRNHGRSRIYARSHISWHGWQAADLMSQYIKGGRQGLPVLEALEIIHLVQTRGCPLAGTAAEEALRDFLAREPRETVDHLFAQTTLDAIENNAVTPGGPGHLKNGPCEEHKRKAARPTSANPSRTRLPSGPTGRESTAQGIGRRPMPWVNRPHSPAA